jgi:hypothetical protein
MSGKPTINAPSVKRIIEAIKSYGSQGCTSTQISTTLGVNYGTVAHSLKPAIEAGLIDFWPQPMGRSMNRRVYYGAGMKPAEPLQPIKTVRKPTKGATPQAAKTLAYRWHTELPPGYVSQINAAECRPWAAFK